MNPDLFTILLLGTVGCYAALAAAAVLVVRQVRAAPPLPDEALPRVSVLVAARNEEAHLPRCLDALLRQAYPAGRIEFLIADDRSTDRTPEQIARTAAADARVRRVALPERAETDPLRGKAYALHHGIRQARGELLLITDADCAPPPHWARQMASQFRDPRTGMVCGVTLVEHACRLDRVQALDWMLLLTVAAAAAAAGLPVTAMGNNMAVRRAAYEDVGGYPALPFSVTEDYALYRAVHRTGTWQVCLLPDAALRNFTQPLPTLRRVFAQRKRWARGGLQAAWWVYLVYLVVFLAHLLLLAGLFITPSQAGPLLVAKLLADLLVIYTGQQRLGQAGVLRSFLLFELYLFAYVIAMPFALLLSPRTRWKGRRW